MMKLFFLPKRRIFERPIAGGKCSSVCTVHQSLSVEDFEIFANRYL